MGVNQADGNGMRNKWIFVAILVVAVLFGYNYWFSSDAEVRNGYELYREGKWEQGRAAFREAIKRNPQNANAYIGLARYKTNLDSGGMRDWLVEREASIEAYSKALELSPNSVVAYLERAQERGGAEAVEDCNKALEIGSLQWVSYCVRAEVRRVMKDPYALLDCELALELEPKSMRAYIARAKIYQQQKQYEQAAADYRKAMDIASDKYYQEKLFSKEYAKEQALSGGNLGPDFKSKELKFWFYLAGGLGYVASGKRDDAVASVADAGDDGSMLLSSFGDYCYSRKQYSDAVFYCTKALKDASVRRRSGIYVQRGNAYRRQKDYANALADYTSAIHLDDGRVDKGRAYYGRGYIYHKQKDMVSAIENYTKAIELAPTPAAYYNRGNCYDDQGVVARAVADYTKAIELSPKNARYYNNRGIAHRKLGNTEQAVADYTKAIELNPKNATYYNNCGTAYQKLGFAEQAEEDFAKAKELEAE